MDFAPATFITRVVGSFLSLQAARLTQACKDDQLCLPGITPVLLWYMSTLSYVDLGLPLPNFKLFRGISSLMIYIETAVVVVISFVSLLLVNRSYIWLAAFPVIAIGFIVALCNALNRQREKSGSPRRSSSEGSGRGQEAGKETRKGEELEAVALVPYWVLCTMGQFQADKFAVSQFLLFFSFVLGALTLMMARLAVAGAAPGVTPASALLRKASLVVLLVAVHAVTAELLGEDVVLYILPGLAPVLLWLSVRVDCGKNSVITADKIKRHRNGLLVLSAVAAAVFAFLAAAIMDESVLSWCTRTLVACGVSGLLLYYVVFMLYQWPGLDGAATASLQEAFKLLKFWANVLLTAAATLLVFIFLAAVRVDLHEPMVVAPAKFFDTFL